MTGCDRCGAQALAGEPACPVCGLALLAAALPDGRAAPHIPVRRHGVVPPPPLEALRQPDESRGTNAAALALATLGVALIVGGLGFWLW